MADSARPAEDAAEDGPGELARLRRELDRLEARLAAERRRASEVERRYRGLVDRLDAIEVRAESAGLGKGAAFKVTLPLARRAEGPAAGGEAGGAPPAERAAGGAAAEDVGPTAGPETESGAGALVVLVIEDNADAAETLGDLLDLFGYRVEVATSGPAGIEAARRVRPDVVLCDIGLPGMDGYAVARELRADPATAGARLVALTGYGGESDRRRAEEAGFDLHLVKPVAPAELQALLAGWAAGK